MLAPLSCEIAPTSRTAADASQAFCTETPRSDGKIFVPSDGPRDAQILKLVCAQSYVADGTSKDHAYVAWHAAFDDRRFDAVRAAMIVVDCEGSGWCRPPYVDVPAHMQWYAMQATPDAVSAELAQSSLPPAVKKAFLDRYVVARQQALADAESIEHSPDAEALFGGPRQVRGARKAYFAKFAADLEVLDATLAELQKADVERRVDPELQKRAIVLRDKHVLACVAEKSFSTYLCWHGTIARPLTRAIAWQAVLAKDALTAKTEHATLAYGQDVQTAAAQIAMVQDRLREGAAGWGPWRVAGVDDGPLEQEVKKLQVTLRPALGFVAGVSPTGVIAFEPSTSGSTSYDCSGEVRYEQTSNGIRSYRPCTVASEHYETVYIAPVTVPAAEVKGVKPGQVALVTFDAKTRRGRLLDTRASYDGPPDRLRMTPLTKADFSDARAADDVVFLPH